MLESMRSRPKYVLAPSIALILMPIMWILWTVSDTSSQSTVIAQSLDSESKLSQKHSDYQQAELKVQEENEAKQAAAKIEMQRENQNLEDSIRDFLGGDVDKVGLVYYDISSGSTISINGDKIFTAASTVKVSLAMITYDMISAGTRKETDTLKFTEASREGGTGILQGENLSAPIQIVTLVEDSIEYSDNIATNMLIKSIGYNQFKNDEDRVMGITTDHDDNEISALGAFNALKKLYDGANNGNEGYVKIIELMKHTIFNDRISKNIPASIVAHKIGNYGSNVHDIGIIYTKNPYILAVYTNGLKDANATISGISDLIYAVESAK